VFIFACWQGLFKRGKAREASYFSLLSPYKISPTLKMKVSKDVLFNIIFFINILKRENFSINSSKKIKNELLH